jgi:hypothetical protein
MGTRVARSRIPIASAVPSERSTTAVATLAPWSKARRAATWLAPSVTAISSSSEMAARRGIGRLPAPDVEGAGAFMPRSIPGCTGGTLRAPACRLRDTFDGIDCSG